jgi:hypothetical protein
VIGVRLLQAPKARINTQVRRRIKVRPTTPMDSEWDQGASPRSTNLRMPADKMAVRSSSPAERDPPRVKSSDETMTDSTARQQELPAP